MPQPIDATQRRPCATCGQLVAAHVVYCPRCGGKLRKPPPESRLARERAAREAVPQDDAPPPVDAPVPVLSYRGAPDPPEPKPRKSPAQGGASRGWLPIVLLIVFGLKALVTFSRHQNNN